MLIYFLGILFLAPIIFPVAAAFRWGIAGGIAAEIYALACIVLLIKKTQWGIFPYLIMCIFCIYCTGN